MIKEEDYLKAKQIVQEYEKKLNISDVIRSDYYGKLVKLPHLLRPTNECKCPICDFNITQGVVADETEKQVFVEGFWIDKSQIKIISL